MAPDQAKGAFIGAFAGIAAGAALGASVGMLWVAFTHSVATDATRMVIAIVIFGIGGSAAGFIAGGALKPRASRRGRRPVPKRATRDGRSSSRR